MLMIKETMVYAKTEMEAMPENCGDCIFLHEGSFITAAYCYVNGKDAPKNLGGYMGIQLKGWLPRPDWCPLCTNKE